MDRRVLIGASVGVLRSKPNIASAQTAPVDVEDRVAELEAKLAELEARVHALEEANSDVASEPETAEELGNGFVWEGTGDILSDPYVLEAGRYKVTATFGSIEDYGFFQLTVYGPNGYEENIFNEMTQGGGQHEVSTILNLPDEGEYFFETGNSQGSWSVSLVVL